MLRESEHARNLGDLCRIGSLSPQLCLQVCGPFGSGHA